MNRNAAFVVGVLSLILASVSKADELSEPIFVAPEFYSADLHPVWLVAMADELPNGEPFEDKGDLNSVRNGAFVPFRKRGYKVKDVKLKSTAYRCTLEHLKGTDTKWMTTLEEEGRRYVFLNALSEYAGKKGGQSLAVSGYLFDTQAKKLLWHGETELMVPGTTSTALLGGVVGLSLRWEMTLNRAGKQLARMFPKNKDREAVGRSQAPMD